MYLTRYLGSKWHYNVCREPKGHGELRHVSALSSRPPSRSHSLYRLSPSAFQCVSAVAFRPSHLLQKHDYSPLYPSVLLGQYPSDGCKSARL